MVFDPKLPIKFYDRCKQEVFDCSQKHGETNWKHKIHIYQRLKQIRVCRVSEEIHSYKNKLHSKISRTRDFSGIDYIEIELDF